jgi:hypothetical protein
MQSHREWCRSEVESAELCLAGEVDHDMMITSSLERCGEAHPVELRDQGFKTDGNRATTFELWGR